MSTTSVIDVFKKLPKNNELMEQFMRWQCRIRQIAMRENQGRPDDSISPAVTLAGDSEPLGHVITIFSKWGAHSKTPEMRQMVKATNDPAQRREKAIRFFSEYYYQHPREFSDTLTATFTPESVGAKKMLDAGECALFFSAFNQEYTLHCKVIALTDTHPLYQATWWHNLLFNPSLHPDTQILAFEPDWDKSSSSSGAT